MPDAKHYALAKAAQYLSFRLVNVINGYYSLVCWDLGQFFVCIVRKSRLFFWTKSCLGHVLGKKCPSSSSPVAISPKSLEN